MKERNILIMICGVAIIFYLHGWQRVFLKLSIDNCKKR